MAVAEIRRSSLAVIACRAACTLLQALVVGPLLLLAFWALFAGTARWRVDEYWRKFPPSFGCDDHVVLDACQARQLMYLFLPTVASALAAIWYVFTRSRLPAAHAPSRPCTPWHQALLPPKAFWCWWCGGLTLSDAAAVAAWLGVNVLWGTYILRRYWSLIPLFSKLGSTPLWVLQVELVAVGLGGLLFPNLALLFYPIARGSILLQAVGLSYPQGIKYHRWLGHWVMWLVTAHSLGFWGVWLLRGMWLEEAFSQGARINNLMGGLSFLAGLALWISSLEVPKRAAYDVFYKLHHIGFWGFFLCGVMHYSAMIWYFLPGLALYAVDAAYRLQQGVFDRSAAVVGAASDGCQEPGVVALQLSCPKYCLAPTGFLWLNLPSLSAHQWHPFEYIAVQQQQQQQAGCLQATPDTASSSSSSGAEGGVPGKPLALLHIKCYSRWTKDLGKLVQQLEQQQGSKDLGGLAAPLLQQLRVRVEGPFGEVSFPHVPAGPQQGLVFVAGGIGIAAALSVLAELPDMTPPNNSHQEQRQRQRQRLLLVWTCRHPGELLLLAPPLVALVGRKGLAVTWHLHYTGTVRQLTSAFDNSSTPAPSKSLQQQQQQPAAARTTPAACAPVLAPCSSSQPGISSMGPVLALQAPFCQAFHKTAVHLAVFSTGLVVLLLVRGASTVWASEEWTTGKTGLACVVGLTVCCVAAGWLVILLGQLGLWLQTKGGGDEPGDATGDAGVTRPLLGSSAAAGKETDPAAAAAAPPAVMRATLGRTATGEVQLSVAGFEPLAVNSGRPDLTACLTAWLRQTTKEAAAAAAAAGCVDEEAPGVTGHGSGATTQQHNGCSSDGPLVGVTVYGMGPSSLLSAAQLSVDALNQSGDTPVPLAYEQRTYEL